MRDAPNLIQGDSDLLLNQLINTGEKFDLILTDPPYNLRKNFGNDSDSLSVEEFRQRTRERISACSTLLTPHGSILWFGIHNYVGIIQDAMNEASLNYRRMNIWRYKNGFSRSKRMPVHEFEPFFWYSKSNTKWTYNVDDIRVPYGSTERLKSPVYYKTASGERKAWAPHPGGAMRGDIWEFPALSGKRFANERTAHPTQKPVSLFIELLKAFTPKNSSGQLSGSVLDPFLGSGTTAVACEMLNNQGHNISWTGIEIEERWINTTKDRLGRTVTPN